MFAYFLHLSNYINVKEIFGNNHEKTDGKKEKFYPNYNFYMKMKKKAFVCSYLGV